MPVMIMLSENTSSGTTKHVNDLSIIVHSKLTLVIREFYILIIHVVCWFIDDAFSENTES